MAAEDEGRTEEPTAKRKREAIKEGRFARTPEFGQWASIVGLTVVLAPMMRHEVGVFQTLMTSVFQAVADPSPALALSLLTSAMRGAFFTLLVFGSVIMFFNVALAIAQGGLHFATKKIKPDFKKLNVINGLKNMFSVRQVWQLAKLLLKVAAVGFIAFIIIRQIDPVIGALAPIQSILNIAGGKAISLLRLVGVLCVVLAGFDYIMVRRQHRDSLKMTKQAVKDEAKQAEGDPIIRSAIRSKQFEAARRRMFSAIPTGDVLLVNPTHYAVVLKYDPVAGAPQVVAKGAGFIAQRIREIAAEHRLATIHDVELTRALYRSCDLGQEIPNELFGAVAQVLAFVITRKRRGSFGGEHDSPRTDSNLPEVPTAAQRRRRRPQASADAPGRPALTPSERSGAPASSR